jgi:hypothetical protein
MGNNSGFEVDLHALDTIAKELDNAAHSLSAIPGAVDGAELPDLNTVGRFDEFRAGYQAFQTALKTVAQAASNALSDGANAVLKTRQYFEQAESENTKNLNSADKPK